MTENPPPPGSQNPEPLPDAGTERKMKRRDFWLGIIGSLIVNAILVPFEFLLGIGIEAIRLSSAPSAGTPLITILISVIEALIWGLPLAVNVAVIILALVKKRPWIAFGILASYGLALAIVVVAGIVFTATCFFVGNQL